VPENHYKCYCSKVVLELSLRPKGLLSSRGSIKVRKASNHLNIKATQFLIIIMKLLRYLEILDLKNPTKA